MTNGKSTTRGHLIEVKASEDCSNRDAIGGWVKVRVGDRIQRRGPQSAAATPAGN